MVSGRDEIPGSPWNALEKNIGNFLRCDKDKGILGKQYSSLLSFFQTKSHAFHGTKLVMEIPQKDDVGYKPPF